jgi:hypothetical protein
VSGGSFRYWTPGPRCCTFWLSVRNTCRLEIKAPLFYGAGFSFHEHMSESKGEGMGGKFVRGERL